MKIKIAIIYLLLTIGACSSAKKISRDFQDTSETNDFFRGLVVYDPETNKVLINQNGNKYFTPASNTKLFTFYTAYRSLQDSVTAFKYKETRDSLIILGTADPSFTADFKESKALEFLKKNERNIYLVDKNIDDAPYGSGWAWDDYSYSYMPENNLFPIQSNLVSISKKGNGLDVVPGYFEDKIIITDSLTSRREPFENIFYVDKEENLENRQIPFKTNNQLVADILTKELDKKVTLIEYKETRDFSELKSVAYDSLYTKMLVESDNFIAEQLLLQVGNQVDSSYSVKKVIQYALNNYFQDIPQKPRWVDGSGLSRYNLFTPESLVYLLTKMYREIPREKLLSYFPVGGVSGTLENYYKMKKPFIYAKSGTLSNNHNLSGYLIAKKGKVLIFSYMNNHYQGSSVIRKREMEVLFNELYDAY